MRGGVLPSAMLCLALGLALAFVPLRVALRAALLFLFVAIVVWAVSVPASLIEPVFVVLWISVIATATTTFLPRPRAPAIAFMIAANAGLWTGAIVSIAGTGTDLARALPLVLAFAPGWWIVERGGAVGLKVGASWLIAISTFAAMLPLISTPGYVPDHME